MTPEQLRVEADNCEQEARDGHKPIILPEVFVEIARAHAALIERHAELMKLAEGMASDLEAEITHRYSGMLHHPVMKRKHDADMSTVAEFRAWRDKQ